MVNAGSGIDRIWLVRHGQIEANIHQASLKLTASEYNRMIVDSDHAHLTNEGRSQIEALVKQFRGCPLPAVHTSPLLRSRQTAAILAEPPGLPIVTMEGFTEIVASRVLTHIRPHRRRSLRYWFIRSMIRQFMPYSRICETAWEGRNRVRKAWKDLLRWRPVGGLRDGAPERLVVTHRGTVSLLRSILRNDPEWEVVRWSIENGGITEIVRR